MLEVNYYDVIISSSWSEISKIKSDTTTLLYEYLDDDSNITITVNIVVINTNGQRSNFTVITKTIDTQDTIHSK